MCRPGGVRCRWASSLRTWIRSGNWILFVATLKTRKSEPRIGYQRWAVKPAAELWHIPPGARLRKYEVSGFSWAATSPSST
jgi:hypothetical protein